METKIVLSKDKFLVDEINKQLDTNYVLYGKRYCPCAIIRDDDAVCMCKDFRENVKEGPCNCGKYIKQIVE